VLGSGIGFTAPACMSSRTASEPKFYPYRPAAPSKFAASANPRYSDPAAARSMLIASMERKTAKLIRQVRRGREREFLGSVLLFGLLGVLVLLAILRGGSPWLARGVAVVIGSVLTLRQRRRNALCRACGTRGAMRRIGGRRFGYVRLRCSECGAQRTVVIPPPDERA